MTWQARMQALTGEGVWLLGWVWALLNVTALAGSALLPRLLARLDRETVLAAAALWRATTLAGAALAAGVWPALTGLVLQEAAFGLTEPVLEAWMNEHVPSSKRRATILSVRSMSATLGGALGLLCLGLTARGLGIPAAWLAAAAVFALAAPGFVFLGRAARGVILGPAVGDGGGDGGILTRATPPR
jgi:MFS family permease